jgi:CPA1 family monovalent cation:H+ antiporter
MQEDKIACFRQRAPVVALNNVIPLLVIAIAIAVICYRLRLPYSIGLVVFGVLIGVVSTEVPALGHIAGETGGLFSTDVFFGILLPPLIYEAALHVDYVIMKSKVWLILALAFLGVIVSTLLTGFLVSEFTVMPLTLALLVGAILSPTDPVAVVALFKQAHVPAQLATIVESESLLNDAVGIVAFTIVLQIVSSGSFEFLSAIGDFLFLVLGGLCIGLAFAALAYFPHKYVEDSNIETTLSLILCYGSFYVAEALGASGIISTAVTGIVTGTLIIPRAMTAQVKETLFSFWSVVAYIANSVIFLSMGLIVNLSEVLQNLPLILIVFVFVTLARAAFVNFHYPLSRISPIATLPRSWYNTLTLAGVRGAIPIVLVLTLTTSVAPIAPAARDTIVSVVIGVALLSVTLQSVAAGWYIKRKFSGVSP